MYLLKRWKIAVVAIIAALAVAVTAGTASANQPGEDTNWSVQRMGDSYWQSRNVPSAAASTTGAGLRFWQSNDDQGNMWISLNTGNPYRIDGNTFDAPVAVPFGAGGFALFHTGFDNRIYWRTSFTGAEGSWGPGWMPVTDTNGVDASSPFSVSVTNFGGAHSNQLYMVLRSNDSRRTILGQFFDGSRWFPAVDLGGVTDHSPAVTYNPVSDELFVVHTGTDTHVYVGFAHYGANPNGGWVSLNGALNGRPSIATLANGNMQVAGSAGNHPWYMELNALGQRIQANWVPDATQDNTVTLAAISLVVFGNTVLGYYRNSLGMVLSKYVRRE